MPNIGTLDTTLRIDTKRAEAQYRRFEQTVNRGIGKNSPFARLANDTKSFERTLGAATNRVVAFGAAAVVFNTLSRSAGAFAQSLIEVDKSLAEINVNLNQSAQGLKQFGGELFNVARQTGQTFETAAKAATELARQGLSAEETIKRLKDALILSRISGLDAASSVETLTAAINSFNKEALTSAEVVNKFAAVDTRFAVSSKDIAEAVQRVGSTAQSAGVGINELIGLVTSLQQTTARGGATIGNGLKTIFTRIQAAPETVSALQSVGVAIKDTNGNLRDAISVLRDYATARTKVGEAERQTLDRTVAGTFQINVLKAALSDLTKQNSIYDSAVRTSNNATDEAIRKNEQLNQTLSSLINSTAVSIKQLVASIGNQDLAPSLRGLLQFVETARKYLSGETGDKLGESLGSGILRGITNVLSGPVILGLGALLGKVFLKVGQTIKEEAKSLFQINNAAQARARIQERINVLLQSATKEEYAQVQAGRGVMAQKEALLAIQARLNRELLVGTELQNAFLTPGRFGVGKTVSSGLKGGFVGGFADPIASAVQRESSMSGLPKSQIYVDKDPRVATFANPAGILVANKRDEPLGGYQGVNRVISQGGNPKKGSVPGFAAPFERIQLRQAGGGFVKADVVNQINQLIASLNGLDRSRIRSVATEIRNLSQEFNKESKALVNQRIITAQSASARREGVIITDQSRYAPYVPPVSGTIDKSGTFDSERIYRAVRNRRFTGKGGDLARDIGATSRTPNRPFGPAYPINPDLLARMQTRNQEIQYSNAGISPTSSQYELPIGPGTYSQTRRVNLASAIARGATARRKQAAMAAQRRERIRSGVFGLSFLAPFASGFVEPAFQSAGVSTAGGTFGGKASGAIAGAAQGAGLGIFGPQAALAGAAIGALVGYFSKASKSLEEFNEAIDKSTAAQQASVDAAGRVASITENLSQGGLSPQAASRFQQQRAEALLDVDPEFRSRLGQSGLSSEDIAKIITEITAKAERVTNVGNVQKGARDLRGGGFINGAFDKAIALGGRLDSPSRGFSLATLGRGFKGLYGDLTSDPFEGVTQARGVGKSLSGLVNKKNIGSIDDTLLNRIIGGKSEGGDLDKLSAIYLRLGADTEITIDKQKEFAEALKTAKVRFNTLSKIIADAEKTAMKGGLLPNAFVNSVNGDTFRDAALTGRSPRGSQTSRGRADFAMFNELIGTGAIKEDLIQNDPRYKQSKAVTQSDNVADMLIKYISGLGGSYNLSQLRSPQGDPRFGSIKRILDTSAKSGSSNAGRSEYLSQFLTQATATRENAGVKPVIPFTEGVSGITPGADYGAFFKQAQETTNKLVEAAGNMVLKTSLSLDGTIKVVSDTLSAPDLQALAQEMTATIGKQFEAQIRDVNVRIASLEGKPLPPTVKISANGKPISKGADGFYRTQ